MLFLGYSGLHSCCNLMAILARIKVEAGKRQKIHWLLGPTSANWERLLRQLGNEGDVQGLGGLESRQFVERLSKPNT